MRKEQDRLRETALQNPFNQVNAEKAAQAIAELERLIQRLQNSLNEADSKVIEEILKSGKKINIALVEVQELLDESVAPFSGIREQAEKTADELRKVVEEIEKGGLTSARLAELNAQKAALEQQAFAARAAAQALRLFADTLNRISTNLVNQVAEEARSNADSARRAANEAAGVADVNGEFGPNGERRRPGDAQRDAQRAEDEAAAAADDARRTQDEARAVALRNEDRQREFENSNAPEAVKFREDIAKQQAIIDDAKSTEKQKQDAQREIDRLKLERQRAFEDSDVGRQAAFEADQVVQNAARRAEEARQIRERNRAADRGRDLGLPDYELRAREARGGIQDIAEAMRQGLLDRQQGQEQAQRFAQEQARNAAPMIFQFADSVENAVLQGPSRQALHASDISTMEGQSELNRLLRGDDEAKNVNLVELRKQNEALTKILEELKDQARREDIILTL